MDYSRRHFVGAALATGVTGLAPAILRERNGVVLPAAPAAPAAPKLADRPKLLDEALAALDAHSRRIVKRDLVGLVDFSAHSSTRRLQLVDLANGRVVESCLVAHGRGSDPAHTGWVHRLSNEPGSNASSGGSYLAATAYVGKHGRSRRLIGLDPQNDQALERAIVVHGADYVSETMVDEHGQIGRSLGCFAVAQKRIASVLERLGEGRLLYASHKQSGAVHAT